MFFTLLVLLATVLGIVVVYLYLRREQDKITSKDEYKVSIDASDLPKHSLSPSSIINNNSCAGFAGLIASIGLFFLYLPVQIVLWVMTSDGPNNSLNIISTVVYFIIGFLFLASLFLLASGVLGFFPSHISNQIFAAINRALEKIHHLNTYKIDTKGIERKDEDQNK